MAAAAGCAGLERLAKPSTVLLLAGLALGEQKWIDLWRQLTPEISNDEVRRNIAITQPLLWLKNEH